MGKEEIARHEQFLLFPQGFQKLSMLMGQNEYLWRKGFSRYREIQWTKIFMKGPELLWNFFNHNQVIICTSLLHIETCYEVRQ